VQRIDDIARSTNVGRRASSGAKGPGGKALMNRGLEEPSIRVTAVQQLNQATSSRSPLLDLKLWAEGTRES